MRAAALALLGVVLLTSACQRAPAQAPRASEAVDHAEEGRKALARQDWSGAASHFRIALGTRSGELGLHFGLAIATSWLDLREEATREFQWVLANAPAGSEEARVAREWLGAGGDARRTAGGSAPQNVPDPTDETVGDSGVHGQVIGDDGQGAGPLKRFQVHLYALGADGKSKGMSFHVRTDQDGLYKFPHIPPGTYKLTDNNVGTPQWRLRVEVKEGEDAVVDLTPRNSLRVRDDFPKSS
jgi:hypothetical protein